MFEGLKGIFVNIISSVLVGFRLQGFKA